VGLVGRVTARRAIDELTAQVAHERRTAPDHAFLGQVAVAENVRFCRRSQASRDRTLTVVYEFVGLQNGAFTTPQTLHTSSDDQSCSCFSGPPSHARTFGFPSSFGLTLPTLIA